MTDKQYLEFIRQIIPASLFDRFGDMDDVSDFIREDTVTNLLLLDIAISLRAIRDDIYGVSEDVANIRYEGR